MKVGIGRGFTETYVENGLRSCIDERLAWWKQVSIFCLESLFRNNIRVARHLLENLWRRLTRRLNQSTLHQLFF